MCFLGKQGKPSRRQTKKGQKGKGWWWQRWAGRGQETWGRISWPDPFPWPPFLAYFEPEGSGQERPREGQGGQEGAKEGQDRCQERDGVLAVADGNGLRKGPELRIIIYRVRDVVHRGVFWRYGQITDYKTGPICMCARQRRGRLCVPYGARMVVLALVCYYVCALLLEVERR